MVIEDSEGSANRCFAVIPWVPGNGEARRPVVLVARETLLHTHGVLSRLNVGGRKRNARQRIAQGQGWNLLRQLVVVTNPVIQGQIGTHFPRILRKERHRFIADTADGITKALDEVGRETKPVLLHRSKVRSARKRRIERGRRQSAKVKEAGEIQLEDGFRYANESNVTAKFEVMVST